jgi:hypothetical protein
VSANVIDFQSNLSYLLVLLLEDAHLREEVLVSGLQVFEPFAAPEIDIVIVDQPVLILFIGSKLARELSITAQFRMLIHLYVLKLFFIPVVLLLSRFRFLGITFLGGIHRLIRQ